MHSFSILPENLHMRAGKILKAIAAVFLLLILLFLLFRNYILHSVIDRISDRLEKRYHMEMTVGSSSFSGLVTVEMHNVTVKPEIGDTLFHLDTLSASPSLGSLILFHIRLKSLEMKNGFIHLACTGSTCNYSNLLSKDTIADTTSSERNYAALFNRFFSKAFDLAPQNAELRNLDLSFITDTFQTDVRIPSFYSSIEKMEGELEDVRQNKRWRMTGTFDQSSRNYDAVIYPVNGPSRLPLLKELFNITAGFDTAHIALASSSYSRNVFTMSGDVAASSFSFFHKRVSDDTVKVSRGHFDYNVRITADAISLDSTSAAQLNKISIHPYFSMQAGKGKIYELVLRTDTTPSTDFFNSLPPGVFDETRDIQADGALQYSLRFKLDSKNPDSVEFDSQMKKIKFHLKKSGKENLFKMNGEFVHTVYEYDRPFRSFVVGPSNPDFTPLDQVAQNLKNAILTSEDGSFFYHNGFNEEAFRKSIAENYRKKKFVRGGSTISMQLVKNVFLSRHKTIARKAEEALMVWLIESNRLCSKERMFEVYLNIIELGPGIYGVGEASRFYFNKRPSDVTLSESIFMASLLPHPKWFRYSFDPQGNLKPYLADYYRVVSNFLLRKNLITQTEYDQIVPNVELKGIAREMVVPSDTIPTDEDE